MKNFVRCVKKGGIREKIRVFCSRSLRGSVDWNLKRSRKPRQSRRVAPYAGAWIEMPQKHISPLRGSVAPYAGAWIEIPIATYLSVAKPSLPTRERGLKCPQIGVQCELVKSLPTRERGLKSVVSVLDTSETQVAPYAGAWIEICKRFHKFCLVIRRSLRGSVDWNLAVSVTVWTVGVAPYAGAWIEIK